LSKSLAHHEKWAISELFGYIEVGSQIADRDLRAGGAGQKYKNEAGIATDVDDLAVARMCGQGRSWAFGAAEPVTRNQLRGKGESDGTASRA
jgi:hypothetical protein